MSWFTTGNLVESCRKVGKVVGISGKVYDGGIRYGEGAHYPRISPTLQDGWIFSRWLSTVATTQKSELVIGRIWREVEKT